jgi:hypothetical protein
MSNSKPMYIILTSKEYYVIVVKIIFKNIFLLKIYYNNTENILK